MVPLLRFVRSDKPLSGLTSPARGGADGSLKAPQPNQQLLHTQLVPRPHVPQ
jgi:hypothetical protein